MKGLPPDSEHAATIITLKRMAILSTSAGSTLPGKQFERAAPATAEEVFGPQSTPPEAAKIDGRGLLAGISEEESEASDEGIGENGDGSLKHSNAALTSSRPQASDRDYRQRGVASSGSVSYSSGKEGSGAATPRHEGEAAQECGQPIKAGQLHGRKERGASPTAKYLTHGVSHEVPDKVGRNTSEKADVLLPREGRPTPSPTERFMLMHPQVQQRAASTTTYEDEDEDEDDVASLPAPHLHFRCP